jgi:hypothetical protein
MTPNNRLAVVTVALVLLAVPAAHAAIATAASFDDKVDNAAAIILGKCVRTESRFDPSGRWIVTYSTFAVEKSFKGDTAGQVTLVTPGGSVGSIHQSTVGVPAFREGDEHVVFVKNTRLGPTVLYFDQGTYDVRTDARGERVIAPVPTNLVTIDTQRGMAVAPSDTPRTLRQFEDAVRDSMRDSVMRKEKMAATPPVKPRPTSLVDTLGNNKMLVVLALLGLALAAWQLRRR